MQRPGCGTQYEQPALAVCANRHGMRNGTGHAAHLTIVGNGRHPALSIVRNKQPASVHPKAGAGPFRHSTEYVRRFPAVVEKQQIMFPSAFAAKHGQAAIPRDNSEWGMKPVQQHPAATAGSQPHHGPFSATDKQNSAVGIQMEHAGSPAMPQQTDMGSPVDNIASRASGIS